MPETPLGDVLTGDANNNVISGLGGSDTISGGDGDDALYGHSVGATGTTNAVALSAGIPNSPAAGGPTPADPGFL